MKTHKTPAEAIEAAGALLKIRGRVHPVTEDNTQLHAELENGQTVHGETNIDVPKHDPNIPIRRVFLDPPAHAFQGAVDAIGNADLIVFGPGDLYTSIIPNFLVEGIPEAMRKARGRRVYICNLMTKRGETNRYTVNDHVDALARYLGGSNSIDAVVYNTKKPSPRKQKKYAAEHAEPVRLTKPYGHIQYIGASLASEDSFFRHDSRKTAGLLIKAFLAPALVGK